MRFDFLAIGDLHFKVSNLVQSAELSKRIVSVVKDRKPKRIFLLGDLHDDHERIHSSVLTLIHDLVLELSKYAEVILIVGNHDFVNNSVFMEPKHPYNSFKGLPNVIVVDRAMDYKFDDYRLILCPYVFPGRFQEALNTVENWKDSSAIICHQEFKNANFGTMVSVKGDLWPVDYPLVISGHIHDRCRLQPNILYIGTPMNQSFGETAEKTISYFTIEDNGKINEELIDLGMPKRISLTMTIDEAKEYKEVPENSIVRVYVEGSSSELQAFKKTSDYKRLEKLVKLIPKPNDDMQRISRREKMGYVDILKIESEKAGPEVVEVLFEALEIK